MGQKKPESWLEELRGDYSGIAVLLLLYTLQGVPMGLAGIFPLVLAEKGATLMQQGLFANVSWPFALKLLWAPVVDAFFVEKWGRRKTWLIPTQLLIAATLFLLSFQVDAWLAEMSVWPLAASCFFLFLLCATQDIAVDGWALTMLSQKNVGWQSPCNSLGQTLGWAVAYVGYFSGSVPLAAFMGFWAVAFAVVTVSVAVLKPERNDDDIESVREVYSQMLEISRLAPVKTLVLCLLTWKVPFAAQDGLASSYLIQAGVKKETIASLSSYMIFVQMGISAASSRFVTGDRPLDIGLKAYVPRVLFGAAAMAVIYWSSLPGTDVESTEFKVVLFACLCFSSLVSQVMFCAQMALISRVADPRIGGTYMTFLNTLGNLGGTFSTGAIFPLASFVGTTFPEANAYYVVGPVCLVYGLIWYALLGRRMRALQELPTEQWHTRKKPE